MKVRKKHLNPYLNLKILQKVIINAISKRRTRTSLSSNETIREFEDHLHREIAKGTIGGFTHLYGGQEAIAVGVCENLRDNDYITSTPRGHGHCIAKRCDVNGMMKELYGRADSLCKGKGGSMHVADMDVGMLGANGIVGGGPPLQLELH